MVLQISCHARTGSVSVKRARHEDEPLTLHTHYESAIGRKREWRPYKKNRKREKTVGRLQPYPFQVFYCPSPSRMMATDGWCPFPTLSFPFPLEG